MSLDVHSIVYGSKFINFKLKYSDRKTLAIHVHPNMSVEVVAPHDAKIEKVYEKIKKRARWIITQQLFFGQFHPKMTERLFVAGETHRYLGRQYRLKITRGLQNQVKLSRGYILITSHYPKDQQLIKTLLEDWLCARASEKFNERLTICLQKFQNPEKFKPKSMTIRKLTNRWGSMTSSGRLVLNRTLIHAPIHCIDYVIIHELCHIQHPNHSPEFWKLLTTILPDWEKRKSQLEKSLM